MSRHLWALGLVLFCLLHTSVAAAQAGEGEQHERVVVSFAEAVRRAVAKNPDAQTARAEIARAQALVEQARSHSLPSLVGLASYTRIANDRVLGGNLIAAENTLAASVALAVPIFSPVNWAQWSHSQNDLKTTEAIAAAVRRAVAIATARSYLGVLTQRRLLAISLLSRDTAKSHYDYAHTRSSGGLGIRLDEMRALDELQADEAAVEVAELDIERAREGLGVLTGESQALDVEDEVELAALPAKEAVMESHLRARADLTVLARRSEAAAAVLADSWRDYAPLLSGALSAAVQNPETTTVPATGFVAQLVLTLPIYDGGLRYGNKRERRALLAEADIARDGLLRTARAEVRIAFFALERAERALRFTRTAANAAQESLRLANLAYRGGAASNLEVIDAERRQRSASVQVAIGEDSVRQARLDVLAAAGLFP